MHRPAPGAVLLSAFDSTQRARNLLSFSSLQQAEVETQLQAQFQLWQKDWGLASPVHDLHGAQPLGDDEARRILRGQLFAESPSGASQLSAAKSAPTMAEVLADEAWQDWLNRLTRILADASATTAAPGFRTGNKVTPAKAWDGCIQIAFSWWQGQWQLQLDSTAVHHVLGKNPAPSPPTRSAPLDVLVPVMTALAAEPLKLSAQFSPVLLTLGQIQGLRVGDVIPLQQRLDEPATVVVQIGDTHTLCAAWLGQRNGQMAAELSALPSIHQTA